MVELLLPGVAVVIGLVAFVFVWWALGQGED